MKVIKAREEGYKKGGDKIDKSTPEQKEEGGCKGFWSYYRNKGDDRELAYLIVDGEKFLSEESVKNLLSEREREVLEEIQMEKISEAEIKELFASWGLWSLVEDISDDGDGEGDNLQLTKEGLRAHKMIKELLKENEVMGIDKLFEEYKKLHDIELSKLSKKK